MIAPGGNPLDANFSVNQVNGRSTTSPSDLVGRRGAFTRHVEVKGTTGTGEHVLVTAGEVRWAREHSEECVLLVVSQIEAVKSEDGEWSASGDSVNGVEPWVPGDDDLEAVSYRCRVQRDGPMRLVGVTEEPCRL